MTRFNTGYSVHNPPGWRPKQRADTVLGDITNRDTSSVADHKTYMDMYDQAEKENADPRRFGPDYDVELQDAIIYAPEKPLDITGLWRRMELEEACDKISESHSLSNPSDVTRSTSLFSLAESQSRSSLFSASSETDSYASMEVDDFLLRDVLSDEKYMSLCSQNDIQLPTVPELRLDDIVCMDMVDHILEQDDTTVDGPCDETMVDEADTTMLSSSGSSTSSNVLSSLASPAPFSSPCSSMDFDDFSKADRIHPYMLAESASAPSSTCEKSPALLVSPSATSTTFSALTTPVSASFEVPSSICYEYNEFTGCCTPSFNNMQEYAEHVTRSSAGFPSIAGPSDNCLGLSFLPVLMLDQPNKAGLFARRLSRLGLPSPKKAE